jgi:hypothetical protein
VSAAVITSRRVSAGIRPDPGTTSRLPAWWGREDWLTEVADALTDEVLREHHIARDTLLAVARAHAAYADHRTGRDCRPTNGRAIESARVSLSTLKRGRRVLRSLGFLVELVRGRSIMTRAERLQAWRRGSSHRQVAAEFALCSRSRRAPKRRATQVREPSNDLGARGHSVDGGPPPGAKRVRGFSHLSRSSLRRRTENEEGGSAPRSYREARGGRPRRLAEAVRDRIGWLRGQSWRRLAPTLGKFARNGWTVRDVELAVRDVLAVRGHRVPSDLRHPAAYLAGILRDVDHEGVRPSVELDAHEAWLREQAAAERAARRARVLDVAGRCVHGVPAHGAGQPSRGVAPCPECRRGAAS